MSRPFVAPTPSAPPTSSGDRTKPCGGCARLLQRRLASGDCAKWRTVLAYQPRHASAVQALVSLAQAIAPTVQWRMVDQPTEIDA